MSTPPSTERKSSNKSTTAASSKTQNPCTLPGLEASNKERAIIIVYRPMTGSSSTTVPRTMPIMCTPCGETSMVTLDAICLLSTTTRITRKLDLNTYSTVRPSMAGHPPKPRTHLVKDGSLVSHGQPRGHLFYTGDKQPYTNFELRAEVLIHPGSNAGIYFHTKYQESGWPKFGFEAQVCSNDYHDPKKTGSLYGVVNVDKAPVTDDQWFDYSILVKRQPGYHHHQRHSYRRLQRTRGYKARSSVHS